MSKQINKVSFANLVIALGIIYGDIGTSPLYVLNAIIHGRVIEEKLILGALSCIIWTADPPNHHKIRLAHLKSR